MVCPFSKVHHEVGLKNWPRYLFGEFVQGNPELESVGSIGLV